MLRTKINVNLGVSRDCKDYDVEMQKVMSAVKLGAVGYHRIFQAMVTHSHSDRSSQANVLQ